MRKGIEEFKSTINPYLHLWKSIELTTFCVKFDNKWVNLVCKTLLSDKEKRKSDRVKIPISLPKFKVIIKGYDIAELFDLIKKIEDGYLKLGKYKIFFKGRNQNEINMDYTFDFKIYEKEYQWYHYFEEYPILTLDGECSSSSLFDHDLEEVINLQLGVRLHPYEDVHDLGREFLGNETLLKNGRPIVTILATMPIKFDERSELTNKKISLWVERSSNIRKKDITIAVIAQYFGMKSRRYLIPSKDFKTKTEDGKHYLIYNEPMEDCISTTILLSYNGLRFEKLKLFSSLIYLENPKLIVQSHFDPNLDLMRKYLKCEGKERKRGEDFEYGITWLLHACGFHSVHYGKGRGIEEEIDVMAFDPKNNIIIAGECTITEPDLKGKLSTFRRKVDQLRDILPKFAILPVLFTPLYRTPESDNKKAQSNGIVISNRKIIFDLLDMAIEQRSVSEIIDKLDNMIQFTEGVRYNWKAPLSQT